MVADARQLTPHFQSFGFARVAAKSGRSANDPLAVIRHIPDNIGMLTAENLKIAYMSALRYVATPRLLKYTAAIVGDSIVARIVVLDTIDDAELDDVYDILGYIMAHFSGTAHFDLVRVKSVLEAAADADLPIVLYHADLTDAPVR